MPGQRHPQLGLGRFQSPLRSLDRGRIVRREAGHLETMNAVEQRRGGVRKRLGIGSELREQVQGGAGAGTLEIGEGDLVVAALWIPLVERQAEVYRTAVDLVLAGQHRGPQVVTLRVIANQLDQVQGAMDLAERFLQPPSAFGQSAPPDEHLDLRVAIADLAQGHERSVVAASRLGIATQAFLDPTEVGEHHRLALRPSEATKDRLGFPVGLAGLARPPTVFQNDSQVVRGGRPTVLVSESLAQRQRFAREIRGLPSVVRRGPFLGDELRGQAAQGRCALASHLGTIGPRGGDRAPGAPAGARACPAPLAPGSGRAHRARSAPWPRGPGLRPRSRARGPGSATLLPRPAGVVDARPSRDRRSRRRRATGPRARASGSTRAGSQSRASRSSPRRERRPAARWAAKASWWWLSSAAKRRMASS